LLRPPRALSLARMPSLPADSTRRLAQQMQFIVEADKLKEITRQTLTSQSRRADGILR